MTLQRTRTVGLDTSIPISRNPVSLSIVKLAFSFLALVCCEVNAALASTEGIIQTASDQPLNLGITSCYVSDGQLRLRIYNSTDSTYAVHVGVQAYLTARQKWMDTKLSTADYLPPHHSDELAGSLYLSSSYYSKLRCGITKWWKFRNHDPGVPVYQYDPKNTPAVQPLNDSDLLLVVKAESASHKVLVTLRDHAICERPGMPFQAYIISTGLGDFYAGEFLTKGDINYGYNGDGDFSAVSAVRPMTLDGIVKFRGEPQSHCQGHYGNEKVIESTYDHLANDILTLVRMRKPSFSEAPSYSESYQSVCLAAIRVSKSDNAPECEQSGEGYLRSADADVNGRRCLHLVIAQADFAESAMLYSAQSTSSPKSGDTGAAAAAARRLSSPISTACSDSGVLSSARRIMSMLDAIFHP